MADDCCTEVGAYLDQDAEYLKGIARERDILVGPTADYYSLERGGNVDPLYGEPDPSAVFNGPEKIKCSVEFEEADNISIDVRSEGYEEVTTAKMAISRLEWESHFPTRTPLTGDVVYVFGKWFDVVSEGTKGEILDTSNFVGYSLELRKRTKFTPDRKVA